DKTVGEKHQGLLTTSTTTTTSPISRRHRCSVIVDHMIKTHSQKRRTGAQWSRPSTRTNNDDDGGHRIAQPAYCSRQRCASAKRFGHLRRESYRWQRKQTMTRLMGGHGKKLSPVKE